MRVWWESLETQPKIQLKSYQLHDSYATFSYSLIQSFFPAGVILTLSACVASVSVRFSVGGKSNRKKMISASNLKHCTLLWCISRDTYSKHITIFFSIDALYHETKPEVVCPLAELLRGMVQSLCCMSQTALKGNSFSWKTIIQILSLPNLAATSNNITRRYTSMFLDADLHNCGNMPNNRLSKHS